MSEPVKLYDATYSDFHLDLREQVRRATYGEDIGQSSWITADEYRRFIAWLDLPADGLVVDVACGSGGPACFLARTAGVRVIGVDVNEQAIATATAEADRQGLADRVRFQLADAGQPLPIAEAAVDGVVCIDALNHLPGRPAVFRDWHRVLKPGGRLLFTDPITVTGMLTYEEIVVRSSIGYFVYTPLGEDERLLGEAGFTLLRREDVSAGAATVPARWHTARAARRSALIAIERETTFEGVQRFLATVATLARERRLSRFVYLATR